MENWDTLVDLRTYYPDIYLAPQSIGITIFVKCPICGDNIETTIEVLLSHDHDEIEYQER